MRQSTNCLLKILFSLGVLCIFCGSIPFTSEAQVRPVYDYGAIGLEQLLKRLNTTKSVMHIGAHPDDEDSGLLAYLARGENARTAYLSLTRGDGGQNIIGKELFESLGVIRTEELLQARRLDGAEQFFTRAFDYGFSKTLDEAKQKWDEKIILCDAVRAIRTFRPLVVISRFSGTPADGHGQHQYAGYIAPLAVKAAADANQCKGSEMPWQVAKFYVSQGFRSTQEPTLKINTGAYDPLLGRSYFEIAMEGRSQHKTQEQGVLEIKGDQFSGLNLIESAAPKVEKETSVFDGIDTSIISISKIKNLPKNISNEGILEMQNLAERALDEYEPNNPQKISLILAKFREILIRQFSVYSCVDGSSTGSGYGNCDKFTADERRVFSEVQSFLVQKSTEFAKAFQLANGIQIDALSNKETVAPDEQFSVTVRVFMPSAATAKIQSIELEPYNGWSITKASQTKENPQSFRRETAAAAVSFDVKIDSLWKDYYTQPYWLKKPRNGYLFDWNDAINNQNLPFDEIIGKANVTMEIGGQFIQISQPIEYRYADDVRGEIRRNLNIVPKISVNLDRNLLIIPKSAKPQTRRIILSIINNSSSEISGEAKLNLPEQIKVMPLTANYNLKNKGEKISVAFDIMIPPNLNAGDFEIGAQVTANGETFTKSMNTIAYPHIQTRRFYTDAKAKINVLDLKIAPVKVGYITGSGDEVPEAIRQMNLPIDLLNETDLTGGDLSKYDVIVVGIRAFQVRTDLIANNQRITDYIKNGGNLIVQYQRPEYENLLPFAAKIGARVVDENAKLTILDAQNPIFNYPNKITDEDFKGWVQERNLYSFTTFDANYKPLLEAHDVNEAENKGGLVVANIGKGKYVYCSYAFFRQLPAGVPGAYRLFANLLSLSKAK